MENSPRLVIKKKRKIEDYKKRSEKLVKYWTNLYTLCSSSIKEIYKPSLELSLKFNITLKREKINKEEILSLVGEAYQQKNNGTGAYELFIIIFGWASSIDFIDKESLLNSFRPPLGVSVDV